MIKKYFEDPCNLSQGFITFLPAHCTPSSECHTILVDGSYCTFAVAAAQDPGLILPLLVVSHQTLFSQVCHIFYQHQNHYPLRLSLRKIGCKQSDHRDFQAFLDCYIIPSQLLILIHYKIFLIYHQTALGKCKF